MPFFDYNAFTRAGSLLVVSYPLATRTGKAVGRSRYVERLRELLGERLVERKFDAASRTAIDRIGTLDDLLTAVAAWARGMVVRGQAKGGGGTAVEGERSLEALYNWLAGSRDPEIRRPMSLIWPCVAGKPLPRLSGELARRFYPPGSGLYLSISQLEKFAACPLQYFVHYTLGLRPREAFALDQVYLGVLHHRILERIYRKIIADEIAWPRCEAPSLRAALEQEVDGAIAELHAELADREPGYEKTRARIKRHLGIILEADRRRACPGSLRPRAVEVFFGGREGGGKGGGIGGEKRLMKLPILQVETAGKHRVFVNGKIDRIDVDEDSGESMAVIDYKSSARRTLELFRVLAGLALQLPVYAMVTRDLAGASPIAALYLGLGINRARVEHAGEAVDPEDERFYQRFQPHGIIDFEGMHLLDPIAQEARKSAWYKMDLTKEGEPAKRSELLTHEDFQAVLDFARFKIAALADALMEGMIAPSPYRQKTESSCGTCDFASLCPFDRATGAYREIPRHSNSRALELMRGEMEGG
jgi:ATP-dependent helicase/nuclease subunit B